MQDKTSLRNQIAQLTATFDVHTRQVMDQSVETRIYDAPWWNNSAVVLGYAAMAHEVDLFPLLHRAQKEGRRVALPRIEQGTAEMHFYFVSSLSDDLQRHRFGFLQPHDHLPRFEPLETALILVPGRGFDRSGNRLGHGAGYYDRFLATCSTASITVGVGYSFQILPRIPREDHDVAMQWIVTDTETISTN